MRLAVYLALSLLAVAGSGLGFAACALSTPGYDGPKSDHFDGERFFNQPPIERMGFGDFLAWQLDKEPGPWRDWVDAEPGPKPPERVGRGELRVTFVNHATTLVQVDGLNILTDPIWSERASPVSFAGPRRVRPPGLRFEDLPPIDVVLLSHNHYDHMDVPTLQALARAHRPRLFAGLGNSSFLACEDLTATDLDWWQSVALTDEVTLTSVPTRHFSNRGLTDQDENLWTGYVISGPAGRVYFAGDTGYGPHFRAVRERLGPPRLAILPIGAYEPRWFMREVHVAPDEAVQAHLDLGAGTSLGMHFGTFRLADDGELEPPEELAAALRARGIPGQRFWVLGFGEGRDVPALSEAGTATAP